MKKQVKPGVILVILFLIGGFLLDIYLLWTPHSTQVEGDVLIHLVFSRNMAEGKIFEYGHNQLSRAGTSILWESLVAGAGYLTGLTHSEEGFLALTRIISVLLLAGFAGLCYKVLKTLNAPATLRFLVPLVCIIHPFTFYWCIANPMETSLALVLIMLLALCVLKEDHFHSVVVKAAVFSLLSFALFLTRPELVLLVAITVVLISMRDIRSIDWAFMFACAAIMCSRRLMMQLRKSRLLVLEILP
ncbi:membrane hypothetical protein [Candidatus Magnetomoraceae bacterium gMMP-13]